MIILENPKYIENVAGVVRAAACFGDLRVVFTGERVDVAMSGKALKHKSAGHFATKRERILREFRHPDYKSVVLEHSNKPFDDLPANAIPVCVEFDTTAERLAFFEHPAHAVYVFGPEDGNVSQVYRRHCHKFVSIPSRYCLNLAAAVNVVLAHRAVQGELSDWQVINRIKEIKNA